MKLNPLNYLVYSNRKQVCRFIIELCYEYDYELTHSEKSNIYNSLIKYSKNKNTTYNSFLDNFKNNQTLYNILSLININNKYSFFTTNEHVYINELDKHGLSLTVFYLKTFGFVNIQN